MKRKLSLLTIILFVFLTGCDVRVCVKNMEEVYSIRNIKINNILYAG